MKRQEIIQIVLVMIWCVWGAGELRAQEGEVKIGGEGESTLTDGRDGKSYRIRLMPDGHYWMAEDLHYGDGYLYDWATAMQQPMPQVEDRYWPEQEQTKQPEILSCAGIKGDGKRCKGICPDGWHIPTKDEFDALNAKFQEIGCRHDSCWRAVLQWNAKLRGAALPGGPQVDQGTRGMYWSSTTYGNDSPAYLMITKGLVKTTRDYGVFVVGMAVRCMRNY